MSIVSRRDFAFMIHPPFVCDFYSRSFSEHGRERKHRKRATALSSSAPESYLPVFGCRGLVSDKFRAAGSGDRLALLEWPSQ